MSASFRSSTLSAHVNNSRSPGPVGRDILGAAGERIVWSSESIDGPGLGAVAILLTKRQYAAATSNSPSDDSVVRRRSFRHHAPLSKSLKSFLPSGGALMCACRSAHSARPSSLPAAFSPRVIIVRSDPQSPNLGRPPQRLHTRRTKRCDRRQPCKLHDGQCGLDTLGDGELLADVLNRHEPDAAMAKLPERQLTGVSSGFDHTAIRSAALQERKVCARINQ